MDPRGILSLFSGRKTYIAAVLVALVAINEQLGIVSPELQMTILALANALGLYGLRDAMPKREESSENDS